MNNRRKIHLWLIHFLGLIVPERLRTDWRQEWEAEFNYRETVLVEWDKLSWQTKLRLFRRSLGACKDALWLQPRRWEDEMIQDLRFGLRMIRKNWGFALIVAITLAFGIGATTTTVSNLDALLLRPFEFPNQDRLAMLFEQKLGVGITRSTISPANIVEWRAQAKTLEAVIVMSHHEYTLTNYGPPERYANYYVSAGFFDALGVKPLLGRTFVSGEDEAGREHVVVLRYAFWQTRFSGDPAIIGKQILLDDKPFTVIGVMPKYFDFPFGGGEMWTPFVIEPKMTTDFANHYLNALALLKPGVTVEQVNQELNEIAGRMAAQHPYEEAGHSVFAALVNEEFTREARVYFLISLGSVLFVWLIACSNVANLMLARASVRQKEMAVRLALGASRWRLLRQLLTESILLALVGGTIGIAFSYWAINTFSKGIPIAMSKYVPGWDQLGLNYRVLAFTLLLSVLTGIIFGLAPALQATKADLNETLKEGGGKGAASNRGGSWTRNVLVVTELALSLVLLIGAGLFVRSFVAMLNTDLGVKPENVMTMQMTLPREQYVEPQQLRNFYDQIIARVAALPGVTHVGATHSLPMSDGRDANPFQIVGQPAFEKGKEPHTDYRIVTPGYFAAIGTDLRRGRLFTTQDNEQAPRVVLANESFVARFLRGRDAIGQRITMGNENLMPMEIIGVVANTMNEDLKTLAEPCVYLPFAQNPNAKMSLVIRAPGKSLQLTPEVRRELAMLDPRLPLTEVKPMQEVIHERRSPLEMMMWMLVIYGVMALAIATVGTYALMAYAVSQRTQEIGIRLALGAQTGDIFRLVMRRGLLLTLIGISLGLAGAIGMTRALSELLYGVSATDALTFAGVSLLLTSIALVACWMPARRAARIDPLVALRHD